MDMFRGFQIILNITKVNKYFAGVLNSLIVLPTPTKYKEFNVKRIKMISQFLPSEHNIINQR